MHVLPIWGGVGVSNGVVSMPGWLGPQPSALASRNPRLPLCRCYHSVKMCQVVRWFPARIHFKQKLVVGHYDEIVELYILIIFVSLLAGRVVLNLPSSQSLLNRTPHLNIAVQYFNRKKYIES